jgi:hypothetical protein
LRFVTIDDSSHILNVAYDVEKQVMYVQFASGSIYRYDSVHADVFGQVVSADSVGIAFNELVKFNSRIPFTLVKEMPVVNNAVI